jgi:hypothetical protein
MRIALCGVPGSGKTAYANKLKPEYTVLDRIPQKFSRKYDVAVGYPATWWVNGALANLRILAEYENKEETNLVSTTTLLDSIAYSSILSDLRDPLMMGHDDYQLGYLIFLFAQTWPYEKVIYFEPKDDGPSGIHGTLDEMYRAIFQEFDGLNVVFA